MPNIRCRIYTQIERPMPELVERFRGLPTANIGDNMNRIYCVNSSIRSLNGRPLLGTAYTLHLPSGDNLLFHKALELAQPGDVLIVASGGAERSYCGELMMLCARNRGLGGFAIDGYVRDIDDMKEADFVVFARGTMPQGPYKNGPGEINVPVAFGGQVVFPGDIVVGDNDGLIFIRPSEAEEVLEKSWAQCAKERALRKRYDAGETPPSFDPIQMNKTLDAVGCEMIDGSWR